MVKAHFKLVQNVKSYLEKRRPQKIRDEYSQVGSGSHRSVSSPQAKKRNSSLGYHAHEAEGDLSRRKRAAKNKDNKGERKRKMKR